MIGVVLVTAGLGIAQGLNTKKQGKAIVNTGRAIANEYAKLNANRVLFENSFEEHKKTIGKIKGYQEETAKLQYNKNKRAVKEALEINLRNVMNGYVSAKDTLDEQVKDMRSKIVISTQNPTVEENSIRQDSLSLLGKEALGNSRVIEENMLNSIKTSTEEGIENQYRVDTDYDNAMSNIRKSYNQSLGNAELQKIQDISRLNDIIESGRIAGANLIQQGYGVIAEGEQKIAKTLFEAGMGMYNSFSGSLGSSGTLSQFMGGQTSGMGAWDQTDKIKNIFKDPTQKTNFLGGIGNGLFR